jgi:hypothetical protein
VRRGPSLGFGDRAWRRTWPAPGSRAGLNDTLLRQIDPQQVLERVDLMNRRMRASTGPMDLTDFIGEVAAVAGPRRQPVARGGVASNSTVIVGRPYRGYWWCSWRSTSSATITKPRRQAVTDRKTRQLSQIGGSGRVSSGGTVAAKPRRYGFTTMTSIHSLLGR